MEGKSGPHQLSINKLNFDSFTRLNEKVRNRNLWFGNVWKEYLEDYYIRDRDNSTNY